MAIRSELVIEWEGDVAQLRADGVVIRDRFWDGLPWRVDITDLSPHAELTLHIVPITTESLIDLDDAARLRVEADGQLCDVQERHPGAVIAVDRHGAGIS